MLKKKPTDNYNLTGTTTSKVLLLMYLIPIFGCFPSLWTLSHQNASREQKSASRLSLTLGLTWLLSYMMLITSTATGDFWALRLQILNSLLTSGYFLVSIWLIFQVIQGKPTKLPGFTSLATRFWRK